MTPGFTIDIPLKRKSVSAEFQYPSTPGDYNYGPGDYDYDNKDQEQSPKRYKHTVEESHVVSKQFIMNFLALALGCPDAVVTAVMHKITHLCCRNCHKLLSPQEQNTEAGLITSRGGFCLACYELRPCGVCQQTYPDRYCYNWRTMQMTSLPNGDHLYMCKPHYSLYNTPLYNYLNGANILTVPIGERRYIGSHQHSKYGINEPTTNPIHKCLKCKRSITKTDSIAFQTRDSDEHCHLLNGTSFNFNMLAGPHLCDECYTTLPINDPLWMLTSYSKRGNPTYLRVWHSEEDDSSDE